MRFYVTFSGADYDTTTERIVATAPMYGADKVTIYDDTWLRDHEFYELNSWLWKHHGGRKGYGWFAWKPLVILDALDRCAAGDLVLYSDADTFPVADLSPIYNIADRDGAMLFAAIWHQNDHWCKRDCFVVMGQDNEKYYERQAGVARYMAFKKGPWKPRQFLMEWLTYCVNPLATTFDPCVLGLPERPGFKEHRTEQAIMTLLAHKYGYKLYREACDSGEPHPQDRHLFGQIFQQVNCTHEGTPQTGSRFRNA